MTHFSTTSITAITPTPPHTNYPPSKMQPPFFPSLPLSIADPSTTILSYDQEAIDVLLSNLPHWIQDYVQWHARMRKKFPGMQLMTDPKAPKILLRTCLGICGGLHDRLGQLPWDLYLANATGRILLLAWQRPQMLEHFLIPNHPTLLDWTVPVEFKVGFDDMHRVRNFTQLFQGMPEDHPTDEFWNTSVDQALERAIRGEFKDVKVLRHRLLGHLGEGHLQERINKAVGIQATTPTKREQLDMTNLVHVSPQFGRIFWLFFRPSVLVEQWVKQIMADPTSTNGELLSLKPQQYSAVHCRVRHPKSLATNKKFLGKNPSHPPDKTGLPWEGDARNFAIHIAKTSLQCSADILSLQRLKQPIYFLADSNDLVKHVVRELNPNLNSSLRKNHSSILIDPVLYNLTQSLTIKARDVSEETVHLDLQKGRPPSAYYATFVDLLMVIHASCVVYGVGYYASFGAKISGTKCQYVYQQEAWGHQAPKMAQACPKTVGTMRKQGLIRPPSFSRG